MTFRPRFVRYLCRMAETLALAPDASRKQRYDALSNRWKSLLGNEPNRMANLANAAAVLKEAFDWHWVGFYLVDQSADNLVLGPFQGPVACTRLHRGKGVCAAAWETKTTQVVPDVHSFPGHVACSSASMSATPRLESTIAAVIRSDVRAPVSAAGARSATEARDEESSLFGVDDDDADADERARRGNSNADADADADGRSPRARASARSARARRRASAISSARECGRRARAPSGRDARGRARAMRDDA